MSPPTYSVTLLNDKIFVQYLIKKSLGMINKRQTFNKYFDENAIYLIFKRMYI